jgi:hypothetical protein
MGLYFAMAARNPNPDPNSAGAVASLAAPCNASRPCPHLYAKGL